MVIHYQRGFTLNELLIVVALLTMLAAPDIASGTQGWNSYSKDHDNSRIADDAVVPPLRLKWKAALSYLDHPSYSRLYYSDGKVMVARMSADGAGTGYNAKPDKTIRAYDASTGAYLWESNCPRWGSANTGTNAEWVVKNGYMWGSTGWENCRIDLSNGDTWILDPYYAGTHNSYVNADDSAIYSMGFDQVSDGNIMVKATDVFKKPVMGHTSDGKFGQAYKFPGVFTVQDYLVANDVLTSRTSDWTVMFWFNWNGVYWEGPKTFFAKGSRSVDMSKYYSALPSAWAYTQVNFNASYISGISLLDPYHGVGGQAVFASLTPQGNALDTFDPGFPFYEWAGATGFIRTSARAINWTNVAANTWYHYAITCDHQNISIYKNGMRVYQNPYTGDIGDDKPGTFYIGGFRELGSFGGKLDEFAVFNKALTDLEIQSMYNAPIEATSTTKMILHFDNDPAVGETDSLIHDYSGNGNDATYDNHINQVMRWRTPLSNPSNMGGGGSGINGNLYGLTMFPGGRGYGMGDIAVHDGILFVPNGKLTAYSTTTGSILWQTGVYPMSPRPSDVSVGGVVYYSGAVYSDGKVYVMGRESQGPIDQTTITVGSGTFVGYTSSQNVSYCSNFSAPALYAFDAVTGTQMGKITMPEYARSTDFAPFGVAPFKGRSQNYYDRRLWTDTYHYQARTFDARMIWESIIQPFQTIVENGIAYVSATDRIAAYDTKTGNTLWEYARSNVPTDIYSNLGASDAGDVILSGNLIYAIDQFSKEIIALDKTNGNVTWRFRAPDQTEKFTGLIEANHTLFASTYNNDALYAFDEAYQNPAITNPLNDSIMPLGYQGANYSFDFTAKDGEYPFTWSVSAGSLPAGLSMTGTNVGHLSGAPTETGDFNFTVQITDSQGKHDERNFTMRVLPHNAPVIAFDPFVPANGVNQTSSSLNISLISSASSAHYSFTDFDRSNILWLPMNEIDKDTSFGKAYLPYVKDHSSYANHATIQGNPTWTPYGYSGGAYTFNGSSYLRLSNSLKTSESLTISLWTNTQITSKSQQVLINSSPAGCYYNPRIYIQNGIAYGYSYLYSSSGQYKSVTLSSNIGIADGNWHQIAMVLDKAAGTMSIYVDGTLKNSASTPVGYWIKSLGTITIGNMLNGNGQPTNYFTGKIDEVLMLNRALEPVEISSLYDSATHQYSNIFTGLAPGPHTVTAYAVDIYGNTSQTAQRSVTVGKEPVIAPMENEIFPENHVYNGPVPQLTTGTLPVTWKLTQGPPGMTINPDTGIVNWPSPTITGSPYAISIQATNPFGQAKVTWSLTIGKIPVIAPLVNATPPDNKAYTGPIPTLTAGTAPITWSLEQGPVGMLIDPQTGVVSWPTPTANGSPFTIIIRAANAVGLDETSWTLMVPTPTPTPVPISAKIASPAALAKSATPPLQIDYADTVSAPPGAWVTLWGISFGNSASAGTVSIGSTPIPLSCIQSWSDRRIDFQVPVNASAGFLSVKVGSQVSNTLFFTVRPGNLYIVNPTLAAASDSNSGDEATPWKTITHGLASLKPGDTLYLAGATYTEPIQPVTGGSLMLPVMIKALPGQSVILQNAPGVTTMDGIVVDGARYPGLSDLIFSGLTLRVTGNAIKVAGGAARCKFYGIDADASQTGLAIGGGNVGTLVAQSSFSHCSATGVALTNGASGAILRDCTVSDAQGVEGGFVADDTATNITLARCLASRNLGDGFKLSASGITVNECSAMQNANGMRLLRGARLQNCWVYGNQSSGIVLGHVGTEKPVHTLVNCTVAGPHTISNIEIATGVGGATLKNTVSVGGLGPAIAFRDANTTPVLDRVIVQTDGNASTPVMTWGSTNFSTKQISGTLLKSSAPDSTVTVGISPYDLFQDYSQGDLRLTKASPARRVGTIKDAPSIDFFRQLRAESTGVVDLGACEYNPPKPNQATSWARYE